MLKGRYDRVGKGVMGGRVISHLINSRLNGIREDKMNGDKGNTANNMSPHKQLNSIGDTHTEDWNDRTHSEESRQKGSQHHKP